MPEYRAYLVGQDGHFFQAVPLVCADDVEAMKEEKHLNDLSEVELWERDRKVAKFDRKTEKRGYAVTYEIHDGRMVPKQAEHGPSSP